MAFKVEKIEFTPEGVLQTFEDKSTRIVPYLYNENGEGYIETDLSRDDCHFYEQPTKRETFTMKDVDLETENKRLKKVIDCLWDRQMIEHKSKRQIKQNYRSMKENRDYWAERCSVHRKRIAYLELPVWIKIKRFFNRK